MPEELESVLKEDKELKSAFESLSVSCRNEYAEYVSSAKKPETRKRRLEKIIPMIREKKGLNDKYKKYILPGK